MGGEVVPIFWFDLDLDYKIFAKLEKVRGKRTQMEYVKEALLEKLDKEKESEDH